MEKMAVLVSLVLVCSAVLLVIRMVLFRLLLVWARRTETKIDDIVVSSIRFPSVFWAVALGASIGIDLSEDAVAAARAHAAANGQTVPIDQAFRVGGENLMHPSDPAGSPENVINCHCVAIPVDSDETT